VNNSRKTEVSPKASACIVSDVVWDLLTTCVAWLQGFQIRIIVIQPM